MPSASSQPADPPAAPSAGPPVGPPVGPAVQVRLLVPDDWRLYRDIRLDMLQESPGAYVVTYDQASAYDEATWRSRLTTTDHFLATDHGRPVGSVGCSDAFGVEQPGDVVLIAMWVAPGARGRGIGALLVTAAVERARSQGRLRMLLDVVDTNPVARRLYERMGFTTTGTVVPYPNDPAVSELQMSLVL